MDSNIKQILEDLYAVDSSLKKHEAELIDIINKLIASKPRIKFDENFQNQLRAELLEKFNKLDNKQPKFNFMNKLYYVTGALAVLVLLVVTPGLMDKKTSAPASIKFSPQIQKLSQRAFGSLSNPNENYSESISAAPQAIGMGGGGGGVATADGKMMEIMPYEPIVYKYVYEGEDFTVDGSQMDVLKRVRGAVSQMDAKNIMQSLNFDNLDLSSFGNLLVRNISLSEDKNFGYYVFLDFYEGMISINENWEKWPTPESNIGINDIPSDDVLIGVANKFLKEHNISLDVYGEPQVDNSWRQYYAMAENKSDFFIPYMTTVVYPLVVDDKIVYDEGGSVYGLRVSINLIHKRVSNVWNLASQNYQSSVYEMETDVDRLLELASRGGAYYYGWEDPNAKVVEIKIGKPYIAYAQVWHYENNASSELLIPALVFPVTNIPDEVQYFYKENVVIPLAKEIIDQRINVNDSYPEPMPLLR